MHRLRLFLLSLAFVVGLLFGSAQTQLEPLSEEAQIALATGKTVMQVALETYDRQYPDRPLWREAISYAKEAVALAPDAPEPSRFLAEVYSRSNWYGPAWQAWRDYLDAGHSLAPEDVPLFVHVGGQLGYTRYSQGRRQEALRYYQQIIEVVPYDKEAYVWSGRILLELGRPEEALRYWETVVERDTTDARARYFLQLAQNQVRWGTAAATAFQEGIAHYEAGELQQAASSFTKATRENADFTQAHVWAGRTLLELGRPAEAAGYWETAATRDPADTRTAYFLDLARDQATWGSDVANAFRAGVQAYESSDLPNAAAQFETATRLRSDYAEAWAWRGRVAFEQGDYGASERYYSRAVDLQPENETYRYFLEESQRRSA